VTSVLVRCVDVARTFGSGAAAVVALHGATCELLEGQQIALTGPSGSGKSTLLHVLAGLDVPTSGDITWPALGDREALRPGPIAVVFQGPSLLPALDVAENVALPLVLAGSPNDSAHERALRALEHLAIADLATRLPEELSGGQAQRVAVARALAGGPRLLLADEPTGQLDHTNAAVVVDALVAAASHLGAALIVATHDPAVASRLPLRWDMVDGRLVTTRDCPSRSR
jgi:putative ABC transport system ATP-binding protein